MSHNLLLQIPGLGVSLKVLTAWVTISLSILNLLQAFYIILTSGVGKNGSTVAVREWCSLLASYLTLSLSPWPLPDFFSSQLWDTIWELPGNGLLPSSFSTICIHRGLQARAYLGIPRVILNHAYSYHEDRTWNTYIAYACLSTDICIAYSVVTKNAFCNYCASNVA